MKFVLLILALSLWPDTTTARRHNRDLKTTKSHHKITAKRHNHDKHKKSHHIAHAKRNKKSAKSRNRKVKHNRKSPSDKIKSRRMELKKMKASMNKHVMYRGLLVHPKGWGGAGSKKSVVRLLKDLGYTPKTIKKSMVPKLKTSKKNKERILFWGWWNWWRYRSRYYNLQARLRAQRIAEWWRMYHLNRQRWYRSIHRNWRDYWRRWVKYWYEIRRQHRAHAKMREQNMLIDVQRAKLKQMDRRKFDLMMMKNRKLDSKNFTRTFIYDAVILTEKILYIEHDKLFQTHYKAGRKHEENEVKKLDKFFAENYKKRNKDLSAEDFETDIFMDY